MEAPPADPPGARPEDPAPGPGPQTAAPAAEGGAAAVNTDATGAPPPCAGASPCAAGAAPAPDPPKNSLLGLALGFRTRLRSALAAAGLEWVTPSDVAALLAGSAAGAAFTLLWQPLLGAWVFAEGCFYVYQSYRGHLIHAEPIKDAAIEPEKREELQKRLIDLGDVLSVRDFFSGWFHGVDETTLLRDNILEFISYGFYCKKLADLAPDERADVDQYVVRVEAKRGVPYPPGFNPDVTFMAHLWEPLRTIHKPLALHAGAEVMRAATDAALWVLGFDKGTAPCGTRYWVRPAGGPALRPAILDAAVRRGASAAARWVPRRVKAALAPWVGGGRRQSRSVEAVPSAVEAEEEEEAEEEGASAATTTTTAVPAAAAAVLRARRPGLLEPADSASSLVGGVGGAPPPARAPTPPSPPPPPAADDLAPLLFVHGVGLGLTPYLHFIAELGFATAGRRPIVLVEARHVSVGLAPHALSTDDVAGAACAVLDAHGWPAAACVGHSYGTFVLSRLVQTRPERVQALALIDPVCMLTIYPQLLRNFVYKPAALLARLRDRADPARFGSPPGFLWARWRPGKGGRPVSAEGASRRSTLSSPIQTTFAAVDSARFLFSRDLTVAASFCRRFIWHRENLFPQDFPHPPSTLLVLAGQDDLVPSALVLKLIDQAPPAARPRVDMNIDAGHGGFLLSASWRARVVAGIVAVADAGSERAAGEAAAAKATLSASTMKAAPAMTLSAAMVKADRGVGGAGADGLIKATAAVE